MSGTAAWLECRKCWSFLERGLYVRLERGDRRVALFENLFKFLRFRHSQLPAPRVFLTLLLITEKAATRAALPCFSDHSLKLA